MPEHEELSPGGSGRGHVTKQMHMAVPKTLLKTQNYLHRKREMERVFYMKLKEALRLENILDTLGESYPHSQALSIFLPYYY